MRIGPKLPPSFRETGLSKSSFLLEHRTRGYLKEQAVSLFEEETFPRATAKTLFLGKVFERKSESPQAGPPWTDHASSDWGSVGRFLHFHSQEFGTSFVLEAVYPQRMREGEVLGPEDQKSLRETEWQGPSAQHQTLSVV